MAMSSLMAYYGTPTMNNSDVDQPDYCIDAVSLLEDMEKPDFYGHPTEPSQGIKNTHPAVEDFEDDEFERILALAGKIDIAEEDYDPKYREWHYDVCIICADEDEEKADAFKEFLEELIQLRNRQQPKICCISLRYFTWESSRLQKLELAIERSTYIFIYITQEFCDPSNVWARIQKDEALMSNISNTKKERIWSVVPVTTKPRKEMGQLPIGLRGPVPINLERVTKGEDLVSWMKKNNVKNEDNRSMRYLRDNLTKMLNDNLHERLKREAKQEKELFEHVEDLRFQKAREQIEEEKLSKERLLARMRKLKEPVTRQQTEWAPAFDDLKRNPSSSQPLVINNYYIQKGDQNTMAVGMGNDAEDDDVNSGDEDYELPDEFSGAADMSAAHDLNQSGKSMNDLGATEVPSASPASFPMNDLDSSLELRPKDIDDSGSGNCGSSLVNEAEIDVISGGPDATAKCSMFSEESQEKLMNIVPCLDESAGTSVNGESLHVNGGGSQAPLRSEPQASTLFTTAVCTGDEQSTESSGADVLVRTNCLPTEPMSSDLSCTKDIQTANSSQSRVVTEDQINDVSNVPCYSGLSSNVSSIWAQELSTFDSGTSKTFSCSGLSSDMSIYTCDMPNSDAIPARVSGFEQPVSFDISESSCFSDEPSTIANGSNQGQSSSSGTNISPATDDNVHAQVSSDVSQTGCISEPIVENSENQSTSDNTDNPQSSASANAVSACPSSFKRQVSFDISDASDFSDDESDVEQSPSVCNGSSSMDMTESCSSVDSSTPTEGSSIASSSQVTSNSLTTSQMYANHCPSPRPAFLDNVQNKLLYKLGCAEADESTEADKVNENYMLLNKPENSEIDEDSDLD